MSGNIFPGPEKVCQQETHIYATVLQWPVKPAYRAAAVLRTISSPSWDLSLGTAHVTLCLLHQKELFIQSFLLQLQLLHIACLCLQFFLQRKYDSVFSLDLVHLNHRNTRTILLCAGNSISPICIVWFTRAVIAPQICSTILHQACKTTQSEPYS